MKVDLVFMEFDFFFLSSSFGSLFYSANKTERNTPTNTASYNHDNIVVVK